MFARLDHAEMKQFLRLLQSLTASHKLHMSSSNAGGTHPKKCMVGSVPACVSVIMQSILVQPCMQLIAIQATAQHAADAYTSLLTCHPHLTEVIEDSHALELLHFAVQAPQGHSRPQLLERLIHELDLLACGQKHDDLGSQV